MNALTTTEGEAVPAIVKLGTQLEARTKEFKKALPSHISPEKLQRTVITAAQSNPDLLTADRQSLVVACMKAAQDGLLPDGREAALVIFMTSSKDAQSNWQKTKLVQYMPMAYGLRKKIVQSGEVVSLQTGLVYRAEMEAGAFLYEVGLEPPIRHRPIMDLPDDELTDDKIVAAYSLAKMKDGTVSVEVMRRGEINKIREMSQTGATRDRKGQPRVAKGPWVDWFGEMARKTVMRRHSKTLPMSGDVIMDVEGRDEDAAISTMAALAVQPDAPMALPNRDELAEQHDPETGEITEPAIGMTEVSEEAARELDAAANGASESEVEPATEPEAPAAKAVEPEQAQEFEWQDNVDMIKADAAAAKSLAALKGVEAEYLKVCASWPKGICDGIEAHFSARRSAIKAETAA